MKVGKDLVAASAAPLVLGILAEGDNYGYAIIQRVSRLSSGQLEWSEGLLYPLLQAFVPTVPWSNAPGVSITPGQRGCAASAVIASARRWRSGL